MKKSKFLACFLIAPLFGCDPPSRSASDLATTDTALDVPSDVPESGVSRTIPLPAPSPEEMAKAARERVRSLIRVRSVSTSEPNSAAGVDLHIVWTNKSNRTVKYAHFTVVPYNAVGDIVEDQLGRGSSFTGQVTGPIRPGRTYGENHRWGNAWYNPTIVRAKLTGITLEYMDGESEEMSEDDMKYVR
jgi:hypothetical protein